MSLLRLGSAIPTLTRWGLSADADLVFRALVLEGGLTAAAVRRSLDLGRRRTGLALEELEQLRLASSGPGGEDGPCWEACAPDRAVTLLRRRRFTPADPWERSRRHLAAVAGLELPCDDGAERRVRRLSLADVRRRMPELVAAERHEHLAMQPEQSFSSEALAAALPLDTELVRRGVRMRIVGRPPADGDLSCAVADEVARLASDYRESDDVPVKLMVFDRRVVLLPAGPEPEHGVLEVTDPDVVTAAVALFTREWHHAHDPRRRGVPRVTLTPRDRAVVDGLARGLTDAEVAQRIRVSTRTVGYTLRALMDRLGVENRFQLGLVLGAAGAAPVPVDLDEQDDRSA